MSRRTLFILSVLILVGALGGLAPRRASAAVTISSFTAKWQGNSVIVSWKTGSELNNAGFNILRSTSANGTFTKVNYTPAQFGSIAGASYSFTDSGVTPGQTYYYRLQSVNTSGGIEPYNQPAVAQAPATPTATSAPPTATRTRTPTMTATQMPGAPTFTPAPPTATPAPPTATPLPQFTPTRTRTYPPGVTPPTPVPPTPTARVAYVVQPTATRAAAPAVGAPAAASPEPTRAAIAVKDPESDDAEAEPAEDLPSAPDESDVRAKQLLIGAAIVLTGLMGAGGLVLGIFAIYLAFRNK
jgi:hypothetical protein